MLAATSVSLIDQIFVTGSPAASASGLGVQGDFLLKPALSLPTQVLALSAATLFEGLWHFGVEFIEDFTPESVIGRRNNAISYIYTQQTNSVSIKSDKDAVKSFMSVTRRPCVRQRQGAAYSLN